MKIFVDQICEWVFGCYVVFGIDGFGCLDMCELLCDFFEVDCCYVVFVVFGVLVDEGVIFCKKLFEVCKVLQIDFEMFDLV